MGYVVLLLWVIGTSTSPHGEATDRTWLLQTDMPTCYANAKLQTSTGVNGALCIRIIGNDESKPS